MPSNDYTDPEAEPTSSHPNDGWDAALSTLVRRRQGDCLLEAFARDVMPTFAGADGTVVAAEHAGEASLQIAPPG